MCVRRLQNQVEELQAELAEARADAAGGGRYGSASGQQADLRQRLQDAVDARLAAEEDVVGLQAQVDLLEDRMRVSGFRVDAEANADVNADVTVLGAKAAGCLPVTEGSLRACGGWRQCWLCWCLRTGRALATLGRCSAWHSSKGSSTAAGQQQAHPHDATPPPPLTLPPTPHPPPPLLPQALASEDDSLSVALRRVEELEQQNESLRAAAIKREAVLAQSRQFIDNHLQRWGPVVQAMEKGKRAKAAAAAGAAVGGRRQ